MPKAQEPTTIHYKSVTFFSVVFSPKTPPLRD